MSKVVKAHDLYVRGCFKFNDIAEGFFQLMRRLTGDKLGLMGLDL